MTATAPQRTRGPARWLVCVLCAAVVFSAACHRSRKSARVRPPRAPAAAGAATLPGQTEYGYASWYGEPYHGRTTSSGEVYNMYAMTAAHRTLPYGTQVEVTNMENGRKVRVRINDRGPFVDGRIIDLSLTAARSIVMVGPGTALVHVKVISVGNGPPGAAPGATASAVPPPAVSGRYTVQVGAFADRKNAERLRARLARRYPQYTVNFVASADGSWHRVWVGNEPTEEKAGSIAAALRRDRLDAFVIRAD